MVSGVARKSLQVAASFAVVVVFGCAPSRPAGAPSTATPAPAGAGGATADTAALMARAKAVFVALPAPPALPPEQVALGRRLFFETRVSADGKIGCVSCHLPGRHATDGLPRAVGVFGRPNPRNSPTVLDAAYQSAEHWHADRESVEDQARRALTGKASFGNASEDEALGRLRALPAPYPAAFARAFPGEAEPVTTQNWGAAIGAYERTLLTRSPFDAFIAGDASALSAPAQEGLRAFIGEGCAECHDGPLLGGNGLKKFGLYAPYAPLTHSDPVDDGRFEATKEERDRFVFKVPQLRNVARTAPYFHDGSVRTLPEAIDIMGQTQLGKHLPPERIAAIVTFLEALTSPVPEAFSPPP